jgi:uncharacterized protein (DUF924 family)
MQSIESILGYWFGASTDEAEVIRDQSALWWKKNPRVDAEIRQRFEATLVAESRDELKSWGDDPRGQLARILLCDQFPRNMYRDTAKSFAFDARARQLARAALDRGLDKCLRPVEKVFAYLPFEHSEDRQDQELSAQLFTSLPGEVAPALKSSFQFYLDFAHKHKAIIDRFGRFPHRNAILGRASTPEELEFLKRPGSAF